MAKLVKVLLAEGHQPIKEVITAEISGLQNVRLLACVQTGNDLKEFLHTTEDLPDVILMDTDIDVDGEFNCTKLIADNYPEITVIVLADSDESLYIRKMIENGADGYMLKESCNQGLKELLVGPDASVPTQINFQYTGSSETHDQSINGSVLDVRERKVLKLLMNQYSSIEISEKLSLESGEIHHTIDRLNEKTKSSNPLELKRYAIKHSIF